MSGSRKHRKPNPLLDSFEAKLLKEYQARLGILTELSLIAHMVSIQNVLEVDSDAAVTLQNEFVVTMNSLAEMLVSDSADDADLWHTKYHFKKALVEILGAENFKKYRYLYKSLVEDS